MSLDLRSMIAKFEPLGDFDNDVASFKTLVPWIGSEAYLNIIFRPAPEPLLSTLAKKLRFPPVFTGLLRTSNGAHLFSAALSLYGVVETAHLLDRRKSFSLPPFNIEEANAHWRFTPERILAIGGYRFDGSEVCIPCSTST